MALILIGLGVAGFGFLASNWIRRPPDLPPTSLSQQSSSSLRKLVRDPRFRRLYLGGFLSSLVLLVPIVHMIPHAVRAGVAPRDAAWLISILGFGSLAGSARRVSRNTSTNCAEHWPDPATGWRDITTWRMS